ncbi:MAG: site-2 protease family protein [Acidimicrobiales bacterium]
MSQTLPPPPLPPSPPPAGSRSGESTYLKFRNEVLAGGASDQPGAEDDTAGGPRAVVGLLAIVGLLALIGLWSPWALLFVIGLIISIFLHEVGHFVTARWTGMKATQFFLFMGPKLWSFRRGETEYGVRLLPVGAFVRIIGMNNLDDVEPADEPRAYRNQSYPRRLLVITAGSIMHMLIAFSLLFGLYATKGVQEDTGRVAISEVVEGAPASEAGVEPGDVILSFDGSTPTSPDEFVQLVQSHEPGDVVPATVERDGQTVDVTIGLGSNPNQGDSFGKAYVGTRSESETTWERQPVLEAVTTAGSDLGRGAWESVSGVFKVLNPVNIVQHLTGSSNDPATQPTTVVGVSRYSGDLGEQAGVAGIILLLAGVNVFVGLFNLFPMLPFDGGHAAIATYERIRSRRGRQPYRADVSKMVPVTMAMFGLLLFLMLSGLYLDIVKPIGG